MINSSVRKVDSESIITAKPIYTEDLILHKDVLTVKLLRSPYAHAEIKSIDITSAMSVEGVVAIYTYKDVPNIRYCMAGQSDPEASPLDRLLLDKTLRYVGDEVAIIAAEDEKSAVKAMKLIKVEYEVLTPITDAKKAENNDIIIHKEDDIYSKFPFGLEPERNIVSSETFSKGDVDEEFKNCDEIVKSSYRTQQQSHCTMETHRAYTYIDANDRLVVVSANQSAYHMRRIIKNILGISNSKIRVIKPRIGGGFGGKNIAVADTFCSFVTWKTRRPAKLVFSRNETFKGSNTRHEMFFDVKVGATKDGVIKAIDMDVTNNSGAYGDNSLSVCAESGHNTLAIYNDINAMRFNGKSVYTNLIPGGALRGYGATQGNFAINSAIDELAYKLNMSPIEVKLKNMIGRESDNGVNNGPIKSCELEQCVRKGKELIGWDDKYPCKDIGDNKVRAVGMSVAAHGSGIPNVDMAIVSMRMDDDGTYKLFSGSSDLGTGSDTIMTQIASEVLNTTVDRISVHTGDTDLCPYDTGAFASCTTFVTGNATIKSAESLKEKILSVASKKLEVDKDLLELYDDMVRELDNHDNFVLLAELGQESVGGGDQVVLYSSESYGMKQTVHPFIAGFCEIELDKSTGVYKVINYACVADCGNVINPTLAKIQVEGGVTQGIGLAMYEDPKFSCEGEMITSNLLQYKIPTKKDIGNIMVDFADNYDPDGPFGAKSLGELVVHTPAPAIADAVFNACGVRIRELPITFEKVYMGMK